MEQTSTFEGWAKVEMMGRNVEVGFVTTRYFGPAALFQIDVPGVDEHEETLTRPEYVAVDGQDNWTPAGAVVKREAIASRTSMIGPSTIYRLTPCTEEVAMKALRERRPRAIAVVSMPVDTGMQLPAEVEAEYPDEDDVDDDGRDYERDEEES